MSNYKTLKAWQHARILAIECVRAAKKFPPEEQYVLAHQLRKAAYSVVLNIIEGSGKLGPKEARHGFDIASGSLDEVEGILDLAKELEYIPLTVMARLEARRDETGKTLHGLLRSVSRAADALDRKKPD